MKYIKYTLFMLLIANAFHSVAQVQKRPMTHDDYALWNAITAQKITNDASFVMYELTPQRGDSRVIIATADALGSDTIYCASQSAFTYDGAYAIARVKAPFASTRQMKIDKKKDDDMPKDTLVVKKLGSKDVKKYAPLSSVEKGKKASWFAFLLDKEKEKTRVKDTTAKDSLSKKVAEAKQKTDVKDSTKKKKIETKPLGKKLCITNPSLGDSLYTFQNVTSVVSNEQGTYFCFVSAEKDSVEHSIVYRFSSDKASAEEIFKADGNVIKPTVDSLGQVAFLYSSDTAKIKTYNVYLLSGKQKTAQSIKDAYSHILDQNTVVSKNYSLNFSKKGTRLFFGVGKPEQKEEKDSLLADEKAKFDLWSWTDVELQPKQLLNVGKEKTRSFMCVYTVKTKKAVRLVGENERTSVITNKGDAPYVICYNDEKYRWPNAVEGENKADVYLVNVSTGEREQLMSSSESSFRLSPEQVYACYFNYADSCIYSMNLKTKEIINISKGIKDDVIYDEDDDHIASKVGYYGVLGFSQGDKYILVYGKYDVWQLDLSGKTDPVNITGAGKTAGKTWRCMSIDEDERFISFGQKMYFSVQDQKTKQNGIYSLVYGKTTQPKVEVSITDKYFYTPIKAKNADKYLIRWCRFNQYPEINITSSLDLKDIKTLSHANPVMDSLHWGTAELYTWRTADGVEQTGVLYKPDNFDPNKKYPAIVYFYETYTDDLYRFYTPAPTYSTVNFPYYVSNDYVIFIPDIKYPKDGYPGLAAEKTIVSGTLSLIDKGFVNPKAIGIQGQSWGGYQTAFLVTRTDMFACAEAGAPVSNMTSAYDGIRWESGYSRNIQYERGQSRIGGTLWERPMQYIENSPLFYAPRVKTPIMIMHNDADGAVPWYQGIEFFVALRRLGKTAWLINYNGDSHNLRPTSWGNRLDLTRRMEQFFGHYLKGEPMPQWMEKGIPATEKGKTLGY